MKEIVLVPKEQPATSLEAEVISPDIFAGKSVREIETLEVFYGNVKGKLGDFFDVTGTKVEDAEQIRIVVDGDVYRTKRIGQEMKSGEILVKGNADMYIGARMKGGRIVVEGDVDSFAALQMAGGELVIKGNAGNYLGSSYRGDWRGMKGGSIVVEGNIGSESGEFMIGGKMHIKGNPGAFLGLHMSKGLIVIDGKAESRLGAQMIGGNIVAAKVGVLLPGFKFVENVKDVEIDGEVFKGKYAKYSGDHAEYRAKGNLYVKQ
ncbi:MAG: formylmethanofuran dehydrogenase subunit C [Candidatus Hydrothermarchaeales archaeon]